MKRPSLAPTLISPVLSTKTTTTSSVKQDSWFTTPKDAVATSLLERETDYGIGQTRSAQTIFSMIPIGRVPS
jgi:hypothetical protein